jgi:hypothetical protein
VTIAPVDIPNAAHSRILRTHSHEVDFQDWPACGRNAAVYGLRLPLPVHIRGAPAKHFGGRVGIWTATTDVVIFGTHAAQAAQALESVRGGVGPGARLPAPAPGAIEGRLHCIR